MASTVETIIQLGFSKSSAARPESFEVTSELIARVGQCLREMFQVIARENPYVIGTSESVSFDGTGWPRPTDSMRVIKVLANAGTIATPALSTGTEIKIVPYDDQLFYEGYASVTELGQRFISTGQSMDPSSGTLLIVYARAPEIPEAAEDTIDAMFPEFFDDILQTDIAAYLAYKERRKEDEVTFLGIKNALVGQMIDWATQQTYGVERRFPLVSPPVTNVSGGRGQPLKGSA
jgi:hypothetical protein